MTFYQFLLDNKVDIPTFIKNCKHSYKDPADDRDSSIKAIINHMALFAVVKPYDWVDSAFIWRYCLQYDEHFWCDLHYKWRQVVGSNKKLKIETVHGFPNPKPISSRKG